MPEKKKRFCKKCRATKNEDNFYKTKNLEKYPEGYLDQCKECITMHVDNWNSDTFLWILQECDVPYVPDEWNKLLASYAKDPSSVTGMTIIGRYLSKMKLKQFKDFTWKDTAFLQEKANHEKEEAMKRQGYGAAEIAEIIEKGSFPVPEHELTEPVHEDIVPQSYEPVPEDTTIVDSLTDEDKLYLRMKWGKAYKPDEWVQLEKLYDDMMKSYDIQGAGHEDNLKLLCKTSLKANQLIDIGDVEGFQKMSRVYDQLMKSGKFTAAQNKAESGEYVDSVGELVMLCEKDGFIPRYYVGEPNDKVDQTIIDMKRYTRTLITEETNLGNLIEEAIKNNQKEDEADANADDTDTGLLDDDDFEEYSEFLDNEEASDADLLEFLSKENERGAIT